MPLVSFQDLTCLKNRSALPLGTSALSEGGGGGGGGGGGVKETLRRGKLSSLA